MTAENAYCMGFRHILDLAEMNRIAAAFRANEDDEEVIRLIQAWRAGMLAAQAVLERGSATLQ